MRVRVQQHDAGGYSTDEYDARNVWVGSQGELVISGIETALLAYYAPGVWRWVKRIDKAGDIA